MTGPLFCDRAEDLRLFRFWKPSVVLLALTVPLILNGCGSASSTRATWVAASMNYHEPYGILPVEPSMTFTDESLRQVVDTAVGGTELRVRLSNAYGTAPLVLDAVHVAKSAGTGAIDASTDTALTFGGQSTVTVPVGQQLWSDKVPFALSAQTDLAISVHVPNATPLETIHGSAMHTTYITAGNTVSAPTLTPITTNTAYAWISGVDVSGGSGGPVIVSIGASISEGAGSTLDADKRYTDLLQTRLLATTDLNNASVVNAGMSGNRLLHNGMGTNLLTRFLYDALGQSHVSHVIVLIGSDDIGYGNVYIPSQAVTPQQMENGYSQLISMAHGSHVKIILGTIPPFNGSTMYLPAGEVTRAAINTWIRSSQTGADGFIDFDKILRDSTDSTKLSATYDSGDHLHPNDAGNQAMANAINLSLFR